MATRKKKSEIVPESVVVDTPVSVEETVTVDAPINTGISVTPLSNSLYDAISVLKAEQTLHLNPYLPDTDDYIECKKLRDVIVNIAKEHNVQIVSNAHILLGTTGFDRETAKAFKYTTKNTNIYIKK